MAPRSVHELLNPDSNADQMPNPPPPPPPVNEFLLNNNRNRSASHATSMRAQSSATPQFPPPPPPLAPVAKFPRSSRERFFYATPQPPQPPQLPTTMPLAPITLAPAPFAAPVLAPTPAISADLSPSINFDNSNTPSPHTPTPTTPGDMANKKRRRSGKSKGSKSKAASAATASALASQPDAILPNANGNTPAATADGIDANGATSTPTGKGMRHVSDPAQSGKAKSIPAELVKPKAPARLSMIDRSPHLKVLPPREVDGRRYQICQGHKGYRSIRGTHPVCTEAWYYEVDIESIKGKGAVRLGWGTRNLEVETPVGYAEGSYAFRCQTGEFVSSARRRSYSNESAGVGDTVGCLIVLPKSLKDNQMSKLNALDEKWLKFYHVQQRTGDKPAATGIVWEKAYCEWFKNGKSLGISDFFASSPNRNKTSKETGKFVGALYMPIVSLYGDAVVAVNMGPKFKYSKPEIAKAYIERAPASSEEEEEEEEEVVVAEKPRKRSKKNSSSSNGSDSNGSSSGNGNSTNSDDGSKGSKSVVAANETALDIINEIGNTEMEGDTDGMAEADRVDGTTNELDENFNTVMAEMDSTIFATHPGQSSTRD